MGCGRLFEGDAATMWRSIQKIIALPETTAVYCAHEYTLANARFAVTVDPENAALRARLLETERARDAGTPTVPTTVGRELETNPFCRPGSEGIRAALGMAGATDAEVFAETRRRKDAF
jgi:hydroxyacylglutathione hydrolase